MSTTTERTGSGAGQDRRRGRHGRAQPVVEVEPLADVAEQSTRSRAGIAGLIIGILLAASAALLVVQNTETVRLRWLWFDADAPMWMMLAGALVAGLLAGPLIVFGVRHSRRRRRERLDVIERARTTS